MGGPWEAGRRCSEPRVTAWPTAIMLALGGGASNALNRALRANVIDIPSIAANTDAQDLKRSLAATRLQLGATLTKGLGAGGDPEVGRDAVQTDFDALVAALAGVDLVVIIACLGGGTGSGGAAVAWRAAEAAGAIPYLVVTLSLPFEGRRRARTAADALAEVSRVTGGRLVVAETPVPPPEDRVTLAEMFARSDASVISAVQAGIGASPADGPQDSRRAHNHTARFVASKVHKPGP